MPYHTYLLVNDAGQVGDDLCPSSCSREKFSGEWSGTEEYIFGILNKKSKSMTIDEYKQHCFALLINGTYNILLRVYD